MRNILLSMRKVDIRLAIRLDYIVVIAYRYLEGSKIEYIGEIIKLVNVINNIKLF